MVFGLNDNKVVKVIGGFVDFTKTFDLIYVNKKESKKNIHKAYEELESDVNGLINYLVKDFDSINEELDGVGKEIEKLEEIKKI